MFENSDFIIILATLPSRDNRLISELANSDATVIYLNAIEDKLMVDICSIDSRYECGSEEGVLSILAKEILKDRDLPLNVKSFFENLDEGYISAECNVGEEEIEEINNLLKFSKKPYIYLGQDIKNHPREENIYKIVSLLLEFGNFDSNISKKDVQNLDDVTELESFDGTVIYKCNILNDEEQKSVIASPQFAIAAKVQDGNIVKIECSRKEYRRVFVVDKNLKGTIALLPGARESNSYSYEVARIVKEDA